jgi:tight adherence protein C
MSLIILLVFACAGVLTFALASLGGDARPVKRRLIRLADGSVSEMEGGPAESSQKPQGPSRLERLVAPLANLVGDAEGLSNASVRRRLIEAGFRRPSAVGLYTGTRISLALILPMLMAAVSPMLELEEFQFMSLLGVAVVIGLVGPSHWIDRKRAARQESIICALPDALDLMVVCVEAGLGINASLARISREFARNKPILSSEFQLVTLETRAGKSTTDALRSLALRSGVAQVASLVAMLVQTERFGTNLADTLRVHADSLRVQRMQRAEEQAGKAPLKMMFPTLIIFMATLLVTLGPGMLQMMTFFTDNS